MGGNSPQVNCSRRVTARSLLPERRYIAFEKTLTLSVPAPTGTGFIPDCFLSRDLFMEGFTLANAFVNIEVIRDNIPANDLSFQGDLAVSSGSVPVQVAQSVSGTQGGGYSGPGVYPLPLLSSGAGGPRASQARLARFVLRVFSNAGGARVVTFRLKGELIAGREL